MLSTDVLVVGAGPTGLTLAGMLAQRGVDVTVIDRLAEGANTSRAGVVHSRTLEVLDELGVAEEIVAAGLHSDRFVLRDRDTVLVEVRFGGLPTKYPQMVFIPQFQTEEILLARFTALGGTVLRPRALVTLDAETGAATLDDGTEIRARYIVGADGMHSTVREQAGIGFTGGTYADSFSLADVRLRGEMPAAEAGLYFSRDGILVTAPLPNGTVRVVATVDDAPEHPDVAYIQGLLDARGRRDHRMVVEEIAWGSRFRVHHRVADSYRSGRVLLAGDAAHVHSPAGGQGMNTGIQDAVRLAGALVAVLGGAPESVLDGYTASRRPVAEQVVAFTDRMTRVATVPRALRPLRNLLIRGLATIPAFRRMLAWRLSGLVYR
ncbi:pentachlorophenol monooxygenase [Longispora fulva]|uniref:2-polyprenyl-6-methoxyphenol hydroxylase-like FAD-dependent oxidoreductase n=1 Tax=Longispora fulva TaxID=619741 RepID=A0A8J7KYV3_9ACTN|nr:FAD-dependent oxidoreductase [Longispora fulva]MBG6139682.1 2-polyprenyl-6-methoxyphenol hydroxylase-like FAD-dependent oxidoreductase [Longispora fulva]GIG57936.1 pentachlorophenol monooxygenase [Longispora fulva]